MTLSTTLHRWTLAALLLAVATTTFAPLAQASPGRRWKNVRHGRPVSRVVIRDRHHGGAGPALAGLVGGLIIGAAISNAHPVMAHDYRCAPARPRYRYEDAYSNRWWDTLDECTDAAWGHHGPRVIRVVEFGSDECVRTLYWHHGHWSDDRYRDDCDWDD